MLCITYILSTLLAFQANSALGAHISSRITGGKDAYPGEYPYQVSIQHGIPPLVKYRPVCGGAIVNESWVLTSASCLVLIPKIGKIQVKAGKHELENDSEWVQTIEASLRLLHSGYEVNIMKVVKPNDIALLKLKNPLQLNERVQPVALPQAEQKPSGGSIVTGWGSISKTVIPHLPKVLQVADVTIISDDNCNDALRSLTNNEKIKNGQICTGPLDKPVSACVVGDLGDPLVQVEEVVVEEEEEVAVDANKTNVLIGITSWAPYPCGQTGSPTVYTQVSSFVDWIESRIEENE